MNYDIDYLRERITMDFSDWLDTAEAKALLALYDAKCEEVERLNRAMKIRDSFLSGDDAARALANVAHFIEPHFTGAKGRAMTDVEIIDAFKQLGEEIEELRSETRKVQ